MTRYIVEVTTKRTRIVAVEADNEEEAMVEAIRYPYGERVNEEHVELRVKEEGE